MIDSKLTEQEYAILMLLLEDRLDKLYARKENVRPELVQYSQGRIDAVESLYLKLIRVWYP